jgi:hypothetical protein
LITVYNENLNINLEFKLIGYTHNEENGQLTLQISNKYNYKDPYAYENDLLGELSATATKVDFSKYNWDKYNDDESLISNFINGELDAAKNQIVTADGQAPIIDHRGIWLRKITNDVTEPKQIRMINNVIAITNDNWNTVSTAITGNGINAEVVRGKLGVFAKLDSHQVTVSPSNEVEPGSLSDFNGVSINSDDGIKVTRTDGLMTTTLNATDGITINDGTDDIFFADTSGNLKIKGQLQAGSIVTDTTINNGSGTFSVDELGNLTASSATINGNITSGSTITGAAINGGTISIGDNFNVSSTGVITATGANISGNITMTGGSISWSSITAPDYSDIGGSKPPTSADNTYGEIVGSGFTYINGNYIYTETIQANQIVGNHITATSSLKIGDNDETKGTLRLAVNDTSGSWDATIQAYESIGPALMIGYNSSTSSYTTSPGELNVIYLNAEKTYTNGDLRVYGNLTVDGSTNITATFA